MSYSCYLGGVEWPTPAKLTVKIKGKNKTLTLLNEGEINFLRTPGLSEIVLPVTLSMLTGSRSPSYYMGVLERLKTSKGTTQFILVRRSPEDVYKRQRHLCADETVQGQHHGNQRRQ